MAVYCGNYGIHSRLKFVIKKANGIDKWKRIKYLAHNIGDKYWR